MSESEAVGAILVDDQDMAQLTNRQQTDHDNATTCGECGEGFTRTNHKVRHHDYISGQYLFAACNDCNLTLKMPNRKRKATKNDNGNESKKAKLDEHAVKNFFLPVVFHNLKTYDAHFVIKHFKNNTLHAATTVMTTSKLQTTRTRSIQTFG